MATPTSRSSLLLKLPVELRLVLYDHLFDEYRRQDTTPPRTQWALPTWKKQYCAMDEQKTSLEWVAYLHIDQQTRNEIIWHTFRNAIFDIEHDELLAFLQCLGPQLRAQVQHISLNNFSRLNTLRCLQQLGFKYLDFSRYGEGDKDIATMGVKELATMFHGCFDLKSLTVHVDKSTFKGDHFSVESILGLPFFVALQELCGLEHFHVEVDPKDIGPREGEVLGKFQKVQAEISAKIVGGTRVPSIFGP
ncbi:hypothetical protein NA57DRAFT_80593 [Rhizodiscina lignyota]|uniref:Uncharacterized protein n=1 Tax=Rhizodiscina lignyota TaxID=1504668 RepID=A0A9P4I6Q0_9PEZI|nr:hypothetical protein NA57DRAFT_80593 [Rhizodiscina lignyota]